MVIQHFTKGKHEKKKGGGEIRNTTIVSELKVYSLALHEKKKKRKIITSQSGRYSRS